MREEDKELLLKDLCTRLPYGVRIHIDFKENGHIVGDATLNTITSITGQIFGFADFEQDFKNGDCCPIGGFGSNKLLRLEEFKPYLRPMSSMTEEERDDFEDWSHGWFYVNEDGEIFPMGRFTDSGEFEYGILAGIEYLIKNHFDYHGLIHMGLALEAPKDLYKIQNNE